MNTAGREPSLFMCKLSEGRKDELEYVYDISTFLHGG